MTRKGVWNLQQVRDKYLQSLWEQVYGFYLIGGNSDGTLGQNNRTSYSSPIQLTGATWSDTMPNSAHYCKFTAQTKTDGTLWSWGYNLFGTLGINQTNNRISSPTQIPGTTWPTTNLWEKMCISNNQAYAIKTDGTLWAWGSAYKGNTCQNDQTQRSSPCQIPGTSWAKVTKGAAIRTDGTLWVWGSNSDGGSGINADRSSPTQVGSLTTWAQVIKGGNSGMATRTDGTLWAWGKNGKGQLGQNNETNQTAMVQIPGTNWSTAAGAISTNSFGAAGAIKTDGTLWVMGNNTSGALGQNNLVQYSSPVQIPGTTWSFIQTDYNNHMRLMKTDGTAWGIGYNGTGHFGQNNTTQYSSPVQIPGIWKSFGGGLNYSAGSKGSLSSL